MMLKKTRFQIHKKEKNEKVSEHLLSVSYLDLS